MEKVINLGEGIRISSDLAVFLTGPAVLGLCDLHIGYEASLQAEAVAIPDFQLEIMMKRLEKLLDSFEPDIVVINGDLKHEFSRNRAQEWVEINTILDMLARDGADVRVVRGNHDNYLKTILAKRGVEMAGSFEVGDFVFVHGHNPLEPDNVNQDSIGERFKIYGHEHPVIRLKDEIGAIMTLPCFLHDPANKFLIMPAFSPLASGTNVTSPSRTFMIKELRDKELADAKIYAVGDDGILDFGTVGALRKMHETEEYR